LAAALAVPFTVTTTGTIPTVPSSGAMALIWVGLIA
jgi:hypothetical protein